MWYICANLLPGEVLNYKKKGNISTIVKDIEIYTDIHIKNNHLRGIETLKIICAKRNDMEENC